MDVDSCGGTATSGDDDMLRIADDMPVSSSTRRSRLRRGHGRLVEEEETEFVDVDERGGRDDYTLKN